MSWLARYFSTRNRSESRKLSAQRSQLSLETLEDRVVPSSTGVLSANFNSIAIKPGSTVWFNSEVRVSGVGASGATLHIDHSTVDYTSKGVTTEVAVPDATLVFSPTATKATTTFDTATDSWTTTVPVNFAGKVFLDGFGLPLLKSLPGGAKNVTWTGTFESDTAGLTVKWDFGAAVYKQFNTNYNALGVKPVGGNKLTAYKNGDPAGTPETYKSRVTAGALGFGGTDCTGGPSAAVTVHPNVNVPPPPPPPPSPPPPPPPPAPSSLAGTVLDEGAGTGLSGVAITLTGTDSQGHSVSLSTTTDGSGAWSFAGLVAGNYTVTEAPPIGNYFDDVANNHIGTAGGSTANNTFTVSVGAGVTGTGYVFNDQFVGS